MAAHQASQEIDERVMGVSAAGQRCHQKVEVLDQPVLPAIGDVESGRLRQQAPADIGMEPQRKGDGTRLGDEATVAADICRRDPHSFAVGEVERHGVVDAHVRRAGANPEQHVARVLGRPGLNSRDRWRLTRSHRWR